MKQPKREVQTLDDNRFFIELSTNIYEVQVILQTASKFTDRSYIQVSPISEDIVGVYFKIKSENKGDLEKVIDDFHNELIDQQARAIVQATFSHIRDQIVKKAFSPIE